MLDITTHGNTGLTGSETSACSTVLSSGMRRPAMRHHHAGVAGRDHGDLAGLDEALAGLDADDPVALAADAGDLAVLDDVHAPRVGAAGIAPGHGIVARGAAAPLQGRAEHRVAQVARC